MRSEENESAATEILPYQIDRDGMIQENGRVIGKTNNVRRVTRRLRRFRKLNSPPPRKP